MNAIKRIAIAAAFSPTFDGLLAHAFYLSKQLNAKLYLIHVGEKHSDKVEKIDELLEKHAGLIHDVIWKNGPTVKSILSAVKENHIDLLIAGALTKDNMITYYLGSVARELVRKAECNVLLIKDAKQLTLTLNKVVINFGTQVDIKLLDYSLNIIKGLNSQHLVLAKECELLGLKKMVNEDLTITQQQAFQNELMQEEWDDVAILNDLEQLNQFSYSTKLIVGKPGKEIAHYVQQQQADLLIIKSPEKRYGIIDRIFQHDLEHILMDLPSNLLMLNIH